MSTSGQTQMSKQNLINPLYQIKKFWISQSSYQHLALICYLKLPLHPRLHLCPLLIIILFFPGHIYIFLLHHIVLKGRKQKEPASGP